MAKRQSSKKGKGSFLGYSLEARLEKNRNNKLKRHLKKFPNDLQAKKALTKQKTPRKASRGHTPEVATVIRDKAGNKLSWPAFSPKNYQK